MRVPSLRKHKSGNLFCRWGGKDHYFGRDEKIARQKYIKSLADWEVWKNEREEAKSIPDEPPQPKVEDVASDFITSRRIEFKEETARYYEKHLVRFLEKFVGLDMDLIRPADINEFKLWLMQYINPETREPLAPKTINHDLLAVKALFNWAAQLEIIPPISLRGVRKVPLGPAPDMSEPVDKVIAALSNADERAKPWLCVNYLALLRPSEVVKVVHEEGEWVEEGVFALDQGKMDAVAPIKRHCIFSPLALEWLERCHKKWTRVGTYRDSARKSCPINPKVLQKSAASHLIRNHEASPGDVELLLGHVNGRLSVTYYQPAWQRLRKLAAKLDLNGA